MTDLRIAPDVDTEPARGSLWVLAGQLVLVVAIVDGFGATQELSRTLPVVIMFLASAAMVMFGPRGQLWRVVVSVPVVLYLSWWLLSVTWGHDPGNFLVDSQTVLPLIAAVLAVSAWLPIRAVGRGLLAGCYVAIAWTVVFTLLNPDIAMVNDNGMPGWRGGFIHKNAMAPFMLFAIATVATFETRWIRRWLVIGVAGFFVLMAQSITTLVTAAVVLGLVWLLRTIGRIDRDQRAVVLMAGSVLGLAAALLVLTVLPSLALTFGKDPTLTSRTDIWAGAIDAIGDRPMTGYGIGGVWVDQAAAHTRAIQRGLGFVVFHAHNGYIEVALQLGLVGLALYLNLIVSFVRRSLAIFDSDRTLATYFIVFTAIVMVTSITEVTTFGAWLALLCGFSTLALRAHLSDRQLHASMSDAPG